MIKERLLSLPVEIETLKMDLLNKQENLRIAREQLKSWELVEMSYISNELDDNGKAKYSNDTKRQAELQHRKDSSTDYMEYEYKAKELDREVAIANIKLDRLTNEQGNLRAICRLVGASND